MISKVSALVCVVAGVLLAFAIFQLANTLWLLPAAREEGRALERAELDAATNKAIGELTDAADRAPFNRRLCIERGGVFINSTSQCEQAKAQPDS
ncbi:MAG TPA: hypothetical protein VL202_01805 [Pararhizobium sp.]|uniref:hypothetical protein n=1 Tax=Pararhizobium sp. TaxID=1977563 RepID=UPI002BE8663E|nr:hypothetical protein [Pararhizobium sp.]HTO29905.1 hypothetical protein [Pararhizobium sp.]